MVVLAQLVRVPDCGSGGRGFEPRIPPKNIKLHLTVRLFLCNGEKFTLSEQSESKGVEGTKYPTKKIKEAVSKLLLRQPLLINLVVLTRR
jgi:hypothetical protein